MLIWNQKQGRAYDHQAHAAYVSARAIIIGLLVAVVVGTCTAVVITRYMTGTLSLVSGRLEKLNNICITNLNTAVTAMEHGDLTMPIATGTTHLNLHSRDEFGQMAGTFDIILTCVQSTVASFRTSQASLRAVIGQLKASALQVSGSRQPVQHVQADGGRDGRNHRHHAGSRAGLRPVRTRGQRSRARQQHAGRLHQRRRRTRETTGGAVRSVARDSETAERATEEATKVALTGVETVRETVTGMHAIQRTIADSAQVIQTLGASSKQIGTIVRPLKRLPTRPTCWPSMPPLKRRGRGTPGAALRSSPTKSANWRNAHGARRRKSAA